MNRDSMGFSRFIMGGRNAHFIKLTAGIQI